MNTNPLISIIVITYNSSKYILETLDSAKKQSYQNIELIISDDCSVDNTVEICEKWIRENGERFVRTLLLRSSVNTGISSNCNRGYKQAQGEWIKAIAGDDLLIDNCIELNVNYVLRFPFISVLQSNTYIINEKSIKIGVSAPIDPLFKNRNTSANLQHEYLLYKYCSNTTTLFIKRSVCESIDFYDEEIAMIEDMSMWLKLTSLGYKLYFFDSYTTMYRKNFFSVSYDDGQCLKIVPNIFRYNIQISRKYIIPYLKNVGKWGELYRIYIVSFLLNSKYNRRDFFPLLFWRLLNLPYFLLNKLCLFNVRLKIKKYLKNIE